MFRAQDSSFSCFGRLMTADSARQQMCFLFYSCPASLRAPTHNVDAAVSGEEGEIFRRKPKRVFPRSSLFPLLPPVPFILVFFSCPFSSQRSFLKFRLGFANHQLKTIPFAFSFTHIVHYAVGCFRPQILANFGPPFFLFRPVAIRRLFLFFLSPSRVFPLVICQNASRALSLSLSLSLSLPLCSLP